MQLHAADPSPRCRHLGLLQLHLHVWLQASFGCPVGVPWQTHLFSAELSMALKCVPASLAFTPDESTPVMLVLPSIGCSCEMGACEWSGSTAWSARHQLACATVLLLMIEPWRSLHTSAMLAEERAVGGRKRTSSDLAVLQVPSVPPCSCVVMVAPHSPLSG